MQRAREECLEKEIPKSKKNKISDKYAEILAAAAEKRGNIWETYHLSQREPPSRRISAKDRDKLLSENSACLDRTLFEFFQNAPLPHLWGVVQDATLIRGLDAVVDPKVAKNHFQNVVGKYPEKEPDLDFFMEHCRPWSEETCRELDRVVTLTEAKTVRAALKKGKAKDLLGNNAEVLFALSDEALGKLLIVAQEELGKPEPLRAQDMLNKARIHLLWKGAGSPTDPNCCRAIVIVNVVTKFLVKTLTTRLAKASKAEGATPSTQGGFKKGQGPEESIILDLRFVEDLSEYAPFQEVFALAHEYLLDLRKAFPSSDMRLMDWAFRRMTRNSNAWNSIRNSHTQAVYSFHDQERSLESGLQEGNPSSTEVFSGYYAVVGNALEKERPNHDMGGGGFILLAEKEPYTGKDEDWRIQNLATQLSNRSSNLIEHKIGETFFADDTRLWGARCKANDIDLPNLQTRMRTIGDKDQNTIYNEVADKANVSQIARECDHE